MNPKTLLTKDDQRGAIRPLERHSGWMKLLFSALVIALTLLSCSKNTGDDDDDEDKTYVTITNNLTNPIAGVMLGSWKGVAQASLIKTIGTLNAGAKSEAIEIKDQSLTQVYIYFTQDGKTYAFSNGWGIGQGINNNLFITGGLPTLKIDDSDQLFPK